MNFECVKRGEMRRNNLQKKNYIFVTKKKNIYNFSCVYLSALAHLTIVYYCEKRDTTCRGNMK